ncbi:hypothetical protein ACFQY7_36680 [Actinomadura luteofluorescens]|uniref:hypothetical protein n=1 Tax=Actinomadura luteofluorescens TaxID=46163 RepID=UPI003635C132
MRGDLDGAREAQAIVDAWARPRGVGFLTQIADAIGTAAALGEGTTKAPTCTPSASPRRARSRTARTRRPGRCSTSWRRRCRPAAWSRPACTPWPHATRACPTSPRASPW